MEGEIKYVLQGICKDLEKGLISEDILQNISALEDFQKLADKNERLLSLSPVMSNKIISQLQMSETQLVEKQHVIHKCFRENLFSKCFEVLLNNISIETVKKLQKSDENLNNYLLNLINKGPPLQVFMCLTANILNTRAGFSQMQCVSLMEEFLNTNVVELFLEQCHVIEDVQTRVGTNQGHLMWDELLLTLSSFPDKMAGKLQNQNSEMFYPKNYIRLLSSGMIKVLQDVHNQLVNNKNCSLEFISRLIGKLCISGYSGILWDNLSNNLLMFVKEDYIWCRICERIVTGVPDKCIESVIVPLLKKIPWYGLVDKFLGDCILTNRKVHYILCTKLLFHRYFDETLLLKNAIGYLAASHTRRHLFVEGMLKTSMQLIIEIRVDDGAAVLAYFSSITDLINKIAMRSLLNVWGDSSAIKHTSCSQHLFISRALMICLGHLTEKEKLILKDEFLRLLMSAVQCHIGSPDIKLRKLGMIVAETITSVLDPEGPKLQFEYDRDEEDNDLMSYIQIPKEEPITDLSNRLDNVMRQEANCEEIKNEKECKKQQEYTEQTLDSDDDLEPFDMSNDVKISNIKSPKYIRDCMEGLICSENPDKVESCLFTAEPLIRKSPDGLQEIAAEFSKILLHLQDSFSTSGFVAIRFGAMVALAVHCPKEVADYLTVQFYERNYNLRQRMDILEVLSTAAQELAKPVEKSNDKQTMVKVVEINPNKEVEAWRNIVDKRIESKTRRFIKGRSLPEAIPVANQFASVAGHFFFPLLRYFDRREASFDLLGEDCVVLRRLIFSLGVILYSALHIPLAQQMCTTLLEFIWALRYHTDSSVRQALLFATSMIILVLPPHCILVDLQGEMMETRTWLEETVDNDSDTECKKMALQALVLIENTIKQSLQMKLDMPS